MTRDVDLCLVMILKDEAAGIAKTLYSIRSFIDRWVILDTGSTDGTQAIVRQVLMDIPGVLYEESFRDFSTSRNRVLELAGGSGFHLMLDGDETIEYGAALREFLQHAYLHNAYYVQIIHGNLRYDHTRISRAGKGWRYVGAVHEVMVGPLGEAPGGKVPAFQIRRAPGDQHKRHKRWLQDVAVLQEALYVTPDDARSTFYLAQTLDCLGRVSEARIMYQKRIALGGWREEVFESKLRLARLANEPERVTLFMKAYNHSPHRAEPLYEIARHFYDKDWGACYLFAAEAARTGWPQGDKLFVDEEVYKWRAADTAAIAAWNLEKWCEGHVLAQRAFTDGPADMLHLKRNVQLFREKLNDHSR